jgi:hypothetical protein
MPYDVPVHQSTKVELIVDGQVRTLTPIRAACASSPPFAVGLAYRRLHILLVREGMVMKRPVRSLPGRLYSLTRPLLLRAMMRKPSCLISCSHGFCRKARRDEPGRQGTLQHSGQIKLCNSDCNQNRAVIWSFGQLVTTPASQGAWWQVPTRRFDSGGSGRLRDPRFYP